MISDWGFRIGDFVALGARQGVVSFLPQRSLAFFGFLPLVVLHRFRLGIVVLALFVTASGCSSSASNAITADQPVEAPPTFDHGPYNALLAEYVNERGMVDYARLQENQETALRPYLRALARTDPSNLSEDARLAFWVNAYNALALKLIVENYPVESIRDVKPSGLPFIPKINSPFKLEVSEVAGKKRTLDEIEHDIIRKEFPEEPRIHAAVVCAAMSCPELRQEAYTGARLDDQLDDQMRMFLRDRNKNRIPAGENQIRLSKIFDWYGGDFAQEGTSKQTAVMDMAAGYFEDERARKLRRGTYDVSYLDYDWSLNEQSDDGGEGRVASGE